MCREITVNILFSINSDGMTTAAGETPKFGRGGHRADHAGQSTVTSRIIGVEVVCGPINTHFVYATDNLVSHGANIMVEVQRQGKLVVACMADLEFTR